MAVKTRDILIFAAIPIAGYFLLGGGMSKEQAAKIISEYTGIDYNSYMGMDKGYLVARAKAFKAAESQFSHNEKRYDTLSGKAIVTVSATIDSATVTVNTSGSAMDWLASIWNGGYKFN